MSRIQRIFTSSPMAIPGVAGSPGGISGGSVGPFMPPFQAGSLTLPAVTAGGAILLHNGGSVPAKVFYQDGQTTTVTRAQMNDGAPTLLIAPGAFAVVTNVATGCTAAYTAGPISVVPGTQQFAVLLDPPDAPGAVTLI